MIDPRLCNVRHTSNTTSKPYFEISFNNFDISQDQIINGDKNGLDILKDISAKKILIQASYAKGITNRMIELTSEYTSAREQFGRPIGSFQAEDGIRDTFSSRGLGDVYKRQVLRQTLALIY